MKALIASLVLFAGLQTVHADPVVLGNPNEGAVIADVKDGKNNQVKVTTHGIFVSDDTNKEETKDAESGATITTDKNGGVVIKAHKHHDDDDGIMGGIVGICFFLFCLAALLGSRYFSSRNEQRRLELLKMMVEKGQTVPEGVVNQILTQREPETDIARQTYKRTRNAYACTVAGVALIGYAIVTHQLMSDSLLVPGLVFLCLGAGGLAGLYLPKREEKIVK